MIQYYSITERRWSNLLPGLIFEPHQPHVEAFSRGASCPPSSPNAPPTCHRNTFTSSSPAYRPTTRFSSFSFKTVSSSTCHRRMYVCLSVCMSVCMYCGSGPSKLRSASLSNRTHVEVPSLLTGKTYGGLYILVVQED